MHDSGHPMDQSAIIVDTGNWLKIIDEDVPVMEKLPRNPPSSSLLPSLVRP